MITLDDVRAAQRRIAPHVHRTPLWHSRALSALLGCEVFLKAELFQKTGSFKPRGMLNKLATLDEAQRRAGVITFSAGNAAQGLAYAAGILGIRATVVMPGHASPTKAQATRDYGGEVILHGTAAECFEMCMTLVRERGLTFISSFDDEALMAGHGSIGLEILEDLPDVDAVVVGVGGGGLIGGITRALRGRGSAARIVGVEPEGAPKMARSLQEGKPVRLDAVRTIADGLGAPFAGELTYAVVKAEVERVVLVTDEQIRQAMRLILERCKLMAEPAGAAPLAGLMSHDLGLARGARVVCVVSGGNVDLGRLKELL
jgi:threonine ammonia-lyase medium form